MKERKRIWILTKEVNDYNQYGEYFIGWFEEKPPIKYLTSQFNIPEHCAAELLDKNYSVYGDGDISYTFEACEEG